MDFDAIVIGAGPAGLSAAAALKGAGTRVLLLDREGFGGQVARLEWIEDYPVPGDRIEGPKLSAALVEAAGGVRMELGEVIELESYSGCRSVTLADGKAYTAPVVIVASGLRTRPLGVPGEDRFDGRGMIHCAFCDGGFYTGNPVAVVGGGDSGLIEALYLAKFASRVHLIENAPSLSAAASLQAQARGNERFDIRLEHRVVAVHGAEAVESLEIENLANGSREKLPVHGVLVHAGFLPCGEFLAAALDLDNSGYVPANDRGVSQAEGIFVAGGVRAGASRRVAAAIEEGKRAAAAALGVINRK